MAKKSLFEGLFPHDTTEKAQKKAEQIIKHATKEAHSILTQATFFHKSLKESLKDELKKALETSIVLFRTELAAQTALITDEFRKATQQELRTMHEHLRKQTEEELKKVEEEVALYKKQKQEKVDSELTELLKKELYEVLHTELPEKITQQLLIKALQQAKKNGFFTTT